HDCAELQVQPNGKILQVGYSDGVGGNQIAVVRYSVDGSLDTSFDEDGLFQYTVGDGVNQRSFDTSIQPADGKLVVLSGWGQDFSLSRLNLGGLQGSDSFQVIDNEPVGPFIVDTLADEDDGLYQSGGLSLREAIRLSNTNIGPDVIEFDQSLIGGTITLSMGHLEVSDDLIIAGLGSSNLTINANEASRVFSSMSGHSLSIEGITLTGGRPDPAGRTAVGGGIQSIGDLALKDVVLTGNSTSEAFGDGGGIWHGNGSLTITNSVISNNSTEAGSIQGGGVRSAFSTVLIQNSQVIGNTLFGDASIGAGVLVFLGDLTITDSTIAENTSTASGVNGGGVTVASGNLSILGSTIANNSVTGIGAGIVYEADGYTATVDHSTISRNHAGDSGGGLTVFRGSLDLTNSTVTTNSANAGRGGGLASFEADSGNSPQTTVTSSIIAGNTGDDVAQIVDFGLPTIETVFSGGFNVIGSGNVVADQFDLASDQTGVSDPGLGLLADNGGPTWTHALLDGSPAINAGNVTASQATDQRGFGFDRLVGTKVDVGALERQPSNPLVSLSVDNNVISEPSGFAIFTANLAEISVVDVVIQLGFSGTATIDSDYSVSDTLITIPAGELSGSITVNSLADVIDDDLETVVVDIISVQGGVENDTQQQTTTIEELAQSAPTDIVLSNSSINENSDTSLADQLFATLNAIDENPGDNHTYQLVAGQGDSDNAVFAISGSTLYVRQNEDLDYEVKPSYAVRIRVTDSSGLAFEKSFDLAVNNLVEVGDADITVGDGTSQRSRVNSIAVQFDSEVVIGADAFTITKRGENDTVQFALAQTLDSQGNTIATLTFSGDYTQGGSLIDGNYELLIDGTKISSVGGHGFDHDKDGVVGDSMTFGDNALDHFYRMIGDSNGDRSIDYADVFAAIGSVGAVDHPLDVTDDGAVDYSDVFGLIDSVGRSLGF
ncbi:MAG: choice-of-anchor Q domain-containing protein, partial [Planctomycetota bacterium]